MNCCGASNSSNSSSSNGGNPDSSNGIYSGKLNLCGSCLLFWILISITIIIALRENE